MRFIKCLLGSWQVWVRFDSAAYAQENLDHWQVRGWRFAVNADMSQVLRQEIEALPQEAWKPWKIEKRGMVREWAEVAMCRLVGMKREIASLTDT